MTTAVAIFCGVLVLFQCGILQTYCQNYQPLPVHYVPPISLQAAPDTTTVFVAPMCGGAHFDGETIAVSINLANHAWNPQLGDIIKVEVKDSHNKSVATNQNASNEYAEDFSFLYNCTMGDIYVYATMGTGVSYVYTIMLIFPEREIFRKATTASICPQRWWATQEERRRHKTHIVGFGIPIMLFPMFLTYTVHSTPNDAASLYRLDYCFGGDEENYSLTVSVIGTDRNTGLGSYVCTKGYKNGTCDTKTPLRDTSGSSINIVSAEVNSKVDNGPIKLIVRGDGRFGTPNHYTIGASRYH